MRRRALAIVAAAPLMLAECGPCGPPQPPGPTTTTTTATTTSTTTTTVAPSDGGYAFLVTDGSRYGRWDPCNETITYQIDTSVPATAAEYAAIGDALDTASVATGFTFEFAGESPDGILAPAVEVLIGYDDFQGGQVGVGGGYYTSQLEFFQGFAYAQRGLPADETRLVLLHEVGHLLGLDHVGDEDQVMYGVVGTLWQQYQSGDREGLRRVGATQPCFPAERSLDRAPRSVTWSD